MRTEPEDRTRLRLRDWSALTLVFAACVVTAPYWLFFDNEDEEGQEPHPAFRHDDR
jgi:hypothetical protein